MIDLREENLIPEKIAIWSVNRIQENRSPNFLIRSKLRSSSSFALTIK